MAGCKVSITCTVITTDQFQQRYDYLNMNISSLYSQWFHVVGLTTRTDRPYQWALSGGRCRGSSATPFQFILITDCQSHPTLYCRWPSFSGHCWSRLEQLPDLVTSAPSVTVFRSRLKTHLFNISYPSPLWLYSAYAVTLSCFWTL